MNKPMRMLLMALSVAIMLGATALYVEYFVKTQAVLDGYTAFKNYEPYIIELQKLNLTRGSVMPFFNASETMRMKLCD